MGNHDKPHMRKAQVLFPSIQVLVGGVKGNSRTAALEKITTTLSFFYIIIDS